MKFRGQSCVALLLIVILASTVLAQKLAEKDPRTSQITSLLGPEAESTGAGGLVSTAENISTSAHEGQSSPSIASAQNSFRAGVASSGAGHYKDAIASLEAA